MLKALLFAILVSLSVVAKAEIWLDLREGSGERFVEIEEGLLVGDRGSTILFLERGEALVVTPKGAFRAKQISEDKILIQHSTGRRFICTIYAEEGMANCRPLTDL